MLNCGIIPARSFAVGWLIVQKLLYGVIAFVALLVIIGYALPRTHYVEASVEIDAHPATVFALVNDFRRYALWSPLVETDPNVRILYSGNPRGVGAIMTWDGTIVGSGSQIIVESEPFASISMRINPNEPGEALSQFRLTPGTGTTIVSWGFTADHGMNFVGRYFASMLGGIVERDYQKGLESLKALAESMPSTDFGDLEIERLLVKATDIAYLSVNSRREPAAMSDAMGKAYFRILNFIDTAGLEVAGAPLSITRTFSGAELAFDTAIPVRGVTDATRRAGNGVTLGKTYEGTVVRVRHIGPYRTLGTTHRKISAYLAAHGIERNGAAWESYVSDPGDVPEQELLTYVYYPIKPT
jgi:effector-binding domain-containing protein